MKKIIFILVFFFFFTSYSQNIQRSWATYFGDDFFITVVDQVTDSRGNIYLVGNADMQSTYTFTTPLAYQPTFGGGNVDGFIVKFNKNGQLVWGTYFGGSGGDVIYSAAIDKSDHITIIGSTDSANAIADAVSYHSTLTRSSDLFLAQFDTDGNKLWGSYLDYGGFSGTNNPSGWASNIGVATDDSNNIYFYAPIDDLTLGTAGTFESIPSSTYNITCISKFSTLGYKEWCTYYGTYYSSIQDIEVSSNGIYVAGMSGDCPNIPDISTLNTYFATSGTYLADPVFDTQLHRCLDAYLSKFNFNGQREWSTYIGGPSFDIIDYNSIKCFGNSIYITGLQLEPNYNGMATTGAFQTINDNNSFLAKFDDTGQRIWGTYCGLNSATTTGQYYTKTGIDSQGNIYLIGGTDYQNNISTVDSYQPSLINNFPNSKDGYVVKFSPDGQRIWGTYYGGDNLEYLNSINWDGTGFYITGMTKSTTGMTTPGCFDNTFDSNLQNSPGYNYFIARFDPLLFNAAQNQLQTAVIFPNPSKGVFTVSNLNEESTIVVFDVLGKKIYEQKIVNNASITLNNVAKGVYFAKISSNENEFKTIKLVVD